MEEVEKEEVDNSEHGAVFYTDGGARPNPGYGGWGIYGYIYKKNPEIKKFNVVQNYYVTHEGYLPQQVQNNKNELVDRDMTAYPNIEIVKYINGYGGFREPVTNNYTELNAAVNAINTINYYSEDPDAPEIKDLTIVCDSDYALKAIRSDLSVLANKNWKDSEGKEVKNKWMLEKIHNEKKRLENNEINLNCRWVKGHSGDPGNEYSDWNATTGVYLSTRDNPINFVYHENPKDYWKYPEDRHPLLYLRRCYFTSDVDTDKSTYIMGEHGKRNSFFMFPRSESVLAVIYLPKVVPTLQTIMKHQLKFLGGSEDPKKKNLFISRTKFSIDMLSLYNKEIQRSLHAFGTDAFYFRNTNNIGLVHANKEVIIEELNPQYLGFQFDEKVNTVEDLYAISMILLEENINNKPTLDSTQENSHYDYIIQDITDELYEYKTEVIKFKPNPINTLIKKHFITKENSDIESIKSIKDKDKIKEAFKDVTDIQQEIANRIAEIKYIESKPTHEVCTAKKNMVASNLGEGATRQKETIDIRGLYFDENKKVKDYLIKLNFNIDIPNRNIITQLEKYNPKFYILSWRDGKVCKHCTIVKLNDGSSGIYHNMVGNRLVIIDGIMK